MIHYEDLQTEQLNERTLHIDECSTEEMLRLINQEDATAADAVREAIPQIARTVDAAAEALRYGGHMIYLGAGTSGRLGVLDASECTPTFGVSPELVQGYIAGGDRALRMSAEDCEDSAEAGEKLIRDCMVSDRDIVIGISASGTAAFVRGALQLAGKLGAVTVAVVNNRDTILKDCVQICIESVTGPEVISGSTRMKAGTADKMILNMISTGTMIRLGRVYGNRMVDLHASNNKLRARAERIFCDVTGQSAQQAGYYLEEAEMDTKLAIMMCLSGLEKTQARAILDSCGGFLKEALEKHAKNV